MLQKDLQIILETRKQPRLPYTLPNKDVVISRSNRSSLKELTAGLKVWKEIGERREKERTRIRGFDKRRGRVRLEVIGWSESKQ